MRQPATVTLYLTAEGKMTYSLFSRRALADCHLAWSPWGPLLVNQRKWELHILKRVNVSNHSIGRVLEDSSGMPFLETLVSRSHGIQKLPAMPGLHSSPYEIPSQHTCVYTSAVSDLHTDGTYCRSTTWSLWTALGLRFDISVVVFCPLIFPACLPCIDCCVVPRGGGPGGFWHGKVCLFVCLLCRGHAALCLFGGSIESTNSGGLGRRSDGGRITQASSPPCVFLLRWRWPDHNFLIRFLESLHMAYCCWYFDRKQPSRET